MTEIAKQHRIAELEHRLRNFEAQLHAARSEQDRKHTQDRVDECRRDLERARTGKWTGPHS
jgi:hypothetical protein